MADGDVITWGPLRWQVLDVPGHTAGHIAWWTQPDDDYERAVIAVDRTPPKPAAATTNPE